MSAIVFADTRGRQVSLGCEHGEIHTYDAGPAWSEEQLTGFTKLVLSARARCSCFRGQRTWMPPTGRPEHVSIDCRLYEVDEPDLSIDTLRPVAITPWAVSLAAERVFETSRPAAYRTLDQDLRLVRLWYRQRQLGLLDET